MSIPKVAIVLGLAVSACFGLSRVLHGGPANQESTPAPVQALPEAEQDARLQSTAAAALGQLEGAIVIVDPDTGRLRAVINPEIAFGKSAPPGSTIKPFTVLAALRSGVIAPDTRIECRQKYKRDDVVDSCFHPAKLPPFTPAEALAHSCNYYFASLGERLEDESVSSLLSDFGFGQLTGVDATDEDPGVLARGRWQPESAVGEGAFLQVTPIQLAMAYAALFNGSKLLRPALQQSTHVRTQLKIEDRERNVLLEGMRGAVAFGTAEKAELDSLPDFVIGKTGTSTPLQGFRPQGWFAGLVFAPGTKAQLLVIVYLKNSRGSEAAKVARPIFEEFAGQPTSKNDSTYVTVNKASDNVVHKLPLEDYILQVVATEASIENEPEALKALAVAARTYALKNIGRHRGQGYDFCSTTHCQRFETTAARTTTAAAIRETANLVLRDDRDELADSYYSAACGGMTANLKSIWNTAAPAYLRGVEDGYCNSGSHYRWTDVIAAAKLLKALRSDPRTDVGETLHELAVTRHDGTGRAELLTLVGDRRRTISGWEFKLIVGRALGWQLIKSSRFTVSRSGSDFVFRGGGFGHGLGLCQEGSHVMARRGQSYKRILAHYFPGTRVSGFSVSPHLRLSSTNFQLTYPKTLDISEAGNVLSVLESSRVELLRRVAAAGIQARFPKLEVVINETTGDFVGRTALPSWAAAATKSNRIELQPIQLLKQRRILETTLRHELAHVLIELIGHGKTPRWLTEGMAVYLAGEGKMLGVHQPKNSMTVESVEKALASAKSATEMRNAYAAAYKLVKELIQAEGEGKVWKMAATI